MICRVHALAHVRNAAIGFLTKTQENRFDHRSMVEKRAGNCARFDPWRHDKSGNADAVLTKSGIVILCRRRVHVIKKTTVFVIRYDEESLVPFWAVDDRVIELQHKFLASAHIRGWVIII